MEEKLFPRVAWLLNAHFDQMPPVEDIDIDDRLHDDLGMDSLDTVDFILAVETNFNVKLDMANAKNVITVRDLCRAIIEQNPSLCDEQ